MDRNNGCACPLLHKDSNYVPDSIDLTTDLEARKYWLKCIEDIVLRFVDKVESLLPGDSTAKSRAEECSTRYLKVLNTLRNDPLILGPEPLSVRILLELNERYLRENGFTDVWSLQKQMETNTALQKLPERLKEIDSLESRRDRWIMLCRGMLAGNMFDWGAKAVTDILDKPQNFGLIQALDRMQPRPWLIDDLDNWLQRLEGDKHKCAVIFVDNAGIDFILGVVPVARELARQGTDVLLCANTAPALNDVTYSELISSITAAADLCPIIHNAITTQKIKCYESGQSGPCLDLRNLHDDLCEAMSDADLVILEGMGRALHTNLNARLSVDCLKLAVIKNEWLANRLGGKKFSVVCQFEPAPVS